MFDQTFSCTFTPCVFSLKFLNVQCTAFNRKETTMWHLNDNNVRMCGVLANYMGRL